MRVLWVTRTHYPLQGSQPVTFTEALTHKSHLFHPLFLLLSSGGLCQGDVLTEALRRYEQLWLPLLAAAKVEGATATLVPPLDVAFVWHLHRLQPAAYAADTAAVAGAKGQPLMVHPEQVCASVYPWCTLVYAVLRVLQLGLAVMCSGLGPCI
jgi:hypothetical protein